MAAYRVPPSGRINHVVPGPEDTGCGTVIEIADVLAVRVPELPVMIALYVPGAAELLTENVTVLVVFVLGALKLAVMPAGSPEAIRLTIPLKPFISTTLMVLA